MRSRTRTGSRLGLAAVILTFAVAVIAFVVGRPDVVHSLANAAQLGDTAHLLTYMLAGPLVLAVPKSVDDLARQASPSVPGQLEAIPWCFYDTQTYVDNTTTTLSFFAATNADKTLTNMEAQASIPTPNYFEVVAFTCDFLCRPSNANAAVTGILDDLALLLNTGRAMFTFTMNQKNYARVPLRAIGSSGGVVGLLQGTTAANQVEEFATNSVPGANPLRIEKAITISPSNNFGVQVDFAAAQDLTANVGICIGMWGVYHRKVT